MDLLPDEDLPQDREGAEDGREGSGAIDYPVGQMVDLQAVRQVADPRPAGRIVGMGDDDYSVAAVDEFLSRLLDFMPHDACCGRGSIAWAQ